MVQLVQLLAFISQIYSFNSGTLSKIQTDVFSAVSFAGSIWSCEVPGITVDFQDLAF